VAAEALAAWDRIDILINNEGAYENRGWVLRSDIVENCPASVREEGRPHVR
jgi:hypothetical protein